MTLNATITDWHGCYEDGWKGMIVPEAFAHPAKFSYSLICRIVRHGLDQGYWKPGETIGDCFGGVATGGIVCGYHNLNWRGVELEPRFVELGNKNLAMHAPRWAALETSPDVRLLQGDSRRFAEVVGKVAGVASSPPYGDHVIRERDSGGMRQGAMAGGSHCFDAYGSSPGQIGALKSGSLDGVVTSPPFADSDTKPTKLGTGKGTRADGDSAGRNKGDYIYGESPGQIGSLKSGSLDGVVTSPPFMDSINREGEWGNSLDPQKNSHPKNRSKEYVERNKATERYGSADGQIGQQSGETYWEACAQVYASMRDAMKPDGVAAIVIKDYVAKGARVPLCDQTCTLLESLGFEVFNRCRCWLVKETREPSLFGGEHVKTTERKSFFRRLAEKKGSPRIDWEEVIWCKR